MEKQEKIRRFIPCSLYCTDKIESWLEEMASEGYIFYTFSKFDYAVFLKDKPQKMYYRLCLRGRNRHQSEMQKLMQKHGWERKGEIKNLDIYISHDSESLAADNDYEISELRDKAIKYRSKQNIISFIFPLLIIATYIFFDDVAISAVNFGIGALLIPISLILFVAARQIIETADIKIYKKHIDDKNALVKNISKINLALYVAKYISIMFAFLSFVFVIASPDANSDIWYSNSDKNENPPFATVEDFVTGIASLKSEDNNDPAALFNKWSNSISAVNYYWRENDMLIQSDGTTEEIQLNVDYHETISPLLAKWLIWDYFWEDKSMKITSEVNIISGYDIDYGLTYHNWDYLVVIAQKGNKFTKAEFFSVRQEPFEETSSITDEEAIEIICSNFQ
ncbi:MAG: DUF2812 domain-containing protein [Clostridia bacterium]|nr:DUF2812 domain-containing protein [Clostridia bacterium]